MNNKIKFLILLWIVNSHAFAQSSIMDIQIRFFEGIREGQAEPLQFVTSSYLHPVISASLETNFELEEEKKQIKRIFNLYDVNLLVETSWQWTADVQEKIFHYFQIDEKEYNVSVVPLSQFRASRHQLKIQIGERVKGKHHNVLDTEITLPQKNIAVFGFEDLQGKPYFLSFHIMRGGTHPSQKPVETIVGGVAGERASGDEWDDKRDSFTKGAIKAAGEIPPPRCIQKVNPVYPELARKMRIEGTVVLNARTDKEGNVESIQVAKGIPPLTQAAIEAVKKWKYEPIYIKNKPVPVVFTVTVIFKLRK